MQTSTFTLNHPKTLAIIPTIEALKKKTENDEKPFNPNQIMKVLASFEEHFKGRPDPTQIPNFMSIHWKIVERQVANGFIISPEIRDLINKHFQSLPPLTNMEQMMEEMFINAY
jgi:hypothetical protein